MSGRAAAVALPGGPPVRAVMFDFDGTLTRPGTIDFEGMRAAIGCPPGWAILEYLASLPAAAERAAAQATVDAWDLAAATQAEPNAGAEEAVWQAQAAGLSVGLFSRNSRAAICCALARFPRLREADFAVVLARDDVRVPKPDPEGLLRAAQVLGLAPAAMVVVGDYVYDIAAGRRAGCRTVLLRNGDRSWVCEPPPDVEIDCLAELAPWWVGARGAGAGS